MAMLTFSDPRLWLVRDPAPGQVPAARDGDLAASWFLIPDSLPGKPGSGAHRWHHAFSKHQPAALGQPGSGTAHRDGSALGSQGGLLRRPRGNAGCSCCPWETLTPRPWGAFCPPPPPARVPLRQGTRGHAPGPVLTCPHPSWLPPLQQCGPLAWSLQP